MGKKKINIKVTERTCSIDKKQRFYTSIVRATPIDDEQLIKLASDDSGIRIEQIAAVYRSLMVQVRELVCNGHSVQLGDIGTFHFKVHAKVADDLSGAGGEAVTRKCIRFYASKHMRQMLYNQVGFNS